MSHRIIVKASKWVGPRTYRSLMQVNRVCQAYLIANIGEWAQQWLQSRKHPFSLISLFHVLGKLPMLESMINHLDYRETLFWKNCIASYKYFRRLDTRLTDGLVVFLGLARPQVNSSAMVREVVEYYYRGREVFTNFLLATGWPNQVSWIRKVWKYVAKADDAIYLDFIATTERLVRPFVFVVPSYCKLTDAQWARYSKFVVMDRSRWTFWIRSIDPAYLETQVVRYVPAEMVDSVRKLCGISSSKRVKIG